MVACGTAHTLSHAYCHTHTHTHTHSYSHTLTHIHTCTHTHTHTHTTHTHVQDSTALFGKARLGDWGCFEAPVGVWVQLKLTITVRATAVDSDGVRADPTVCERQCLCWLHLLFVCVIRVEALLQF